VSRSWTEVLTEIQQKVEQKEYEMSLHARFRAAIRDINLDRLKEVIAHGTIVNEEIKPHQNPKYWIEGETEQGIPIGMIVGLGDKVYIRTVYNLDE
jgi:hypothetical protein